MWTRLTRLICGRLNNDDESMVKNCMVITMLAAKLLEIY